MDNQCVATVYGERLTSWQCTRRAVKDGYCKQHHPDAVAERERAQRVKVDREIRADTLKWESLGRRDQVVSVACDLASGKATVRELKQAVKRYDDADRAFREAAEAARSTK